MKSLSDVAIVIHKTSLTFVTHLVIFPDWPVYHSRGGNKCTACSGLVLPTRGVCMFEVVPLLQNS